MTRHPDQCGQAMLEFLLVCAVLVIALFLPYLDGRSVTSLLLHALMEVFRARSFLVSIV